MSLNTEEYLARMAPIYEGSLQLCNDLSSGFKRKVTGEELSALLQRGRSTLEGYRGVLAQLDDRRKAEAVASYGDMMARVERFLKQLEEWAAHGAI